MLRGMQGRREPLIIFKFEMFYAGSEVLMAHSSITVAPKFIYLFTMYLTKLQ